MHRLYKQAAKPHSSSQLSFEKASNMTTDDTCMDDPDSEERCADVDEVQNTSCHSLKPLAVSMFDICLYMYIYIFEVCKDRDLIHIKNIYEFC